MPTASQPRRPRRAGLGKRIIEPITKLPEYRKLTTLAELETVCNVPVIVESFIGESPVRFEGRRLKPCEEREIKALLHAAFPPELPPLEPGGEPRYDLNNPEYEATKETNRRKARALALYWAFPLFADGLPAVEGKPPTPQQILEYVEARPIDVSVLELAYQMVTREIVMVDPRRVGFTSGNNSRAS